jgi:hypothetical protein
MGLESRQVQGIEEELLPVKVSEYLAVMSIAQLVGSPPGAVMATTPQEAAISDVRRCLAFCKEVSLPVAGIVENMSGLVCPKCGERIDFFKHGGGLALALEMNIRSLGQIPTDPEVVMAGDAGIPRLRDGPQSPAAKAFSGVVNSILTGDLLPSGAKQADNEGCGS